MFYDYFSYIFRCMPHNLRLNVKCKINLSRNIIRIGNYSVGLNLKLLSISLWLPYILRVFLPPFFLYQVEDILSVILRNKIIVHKESLPSDLKVYDKEDYLSIPISTPSNYPPNVDVVYSELKLWLERAQGFYIASRDWRKLFEISLTVMDSTGYLVFPR